MALISFPILTIVVVGILVLTFLIRRSNKSQEEDIDDFWKREKQARTTPPKDISTLAYLNVPLQRFPMGKMADPDITRIEQQIIELSRKPLLNLTGKTNTELRETYGAPNLEAMKAIGDDFDNLTMLLVAYAQALVDKGMEDDAIPVLEYSVSINTDISKSYTLLGDLYFSKKQRQRIEMLKDQVRPLNLLRGNLIIEYLDGLTNKLVGEGTENFTVSDESNPKEDSEQSE